jgi:protease-4
MSVCTGYTFDMKTRDIAIIAAAMCVVGLMELVGFVTYVRSDSKAALSGGSNEMYGNGCNVAYIPLHGELFTYGVQSDSTSSAAGSNYTASEDVTQQIRAAEADSSTEAIILEIDSGGGDPVAGEEIESALKRSTKPTVALIRSVGDSAAYMAASGARTIYASSFSDVGSIGVTASYSDVSKQDIQNGITFHQLSTGKYKDLFNADKPMTADEQALIQKQLQQYFGHFIDMVAANRHLDREKVVALADGSSMTGDDALAAGLVDKIGSVDDVRANLSTQLGHDALICGIDDSMTE